MVARRFVCHRYVRVAAIRSLCKISVVSLDSKEIGKANETKARGGTGTATIAPCVFGAN